MYQASKELRDIQLRCTEIVAALDAFCRKHKIEYALCGGSAIGAYQYGGFIPWDDDIDVMMTRKNYRKFLRLWKREQHEYELHHYTNDEHILIMFAKLVDPASTIVECADGLEEVVSGAFVDITVFDASGGKLFTVIKRKMSHLCYYITLAANIPSTSVIPAFRHVPKWLRRCIIRITEAFLQIHGPHPSEVQEYWAMDGNCDCIRYPKELFDEYSDTEFEGKKFRVLKENYNYLTIAYNRTSFMIPEDQQIPHHYKYSDMNCPYREYIAQHETRL